jgi:DNA-binding helix-hairpin-helix protein with protein kinase domain
LETWKKQYDNLDAKRTSQLQHAHLNHQKNQQNEMRQQLKNYLQQFPLSKAKISGIGRSRIATLQNHGIITAADVEKNRLLGIQSFGTVLTQQLLDWQQSCSQGFCFRPTNISKNNIQAIEQKFIIQRQNIEHQLRAGFNQLLTIKQAVEAHYKKNESEIKLTWTIFLQAKADEEYLK